MSNDTSFIRFDPSSPGDIGGSVPATGEFKQITVTPDESHAYGVRILVTDPSSHGTPQGALRLDVLDPTDPNPALNIYNNGTGPDIQLASGVTITEVAGQLVFTDPVAGSVPLISTGGGTASNENIGGIGVFETKAAGNFEFRGIFAASSRISVLLNGANKRIDLDVNQANLVLLASQISNFSASVSAVPAVVANTAKVSASGSINTHSDVNLTGAIEGDILVLQTGEFKPKALSAAHVSYSDLITGLGATTVQGAVEALDARVDNIEANEGEANDGANINLAGVGVYDSKGGIYLRFRGISTASTRLSVIHDIPNNAIQLDVNQTNLLLTASQISDFSAAVASNSAVALNTAKVSASGSVSTHSDVNTAGAITGQILRRNGFGVWVPQDLGSNIVQFDDSGVAFTATEVQTAFEQLDAIVALNTAKVSADGSVGTHSDVSLTGIVSGQHLEWNGSSFVPGDGGNVRISSAPVTDNRVARFDGSTGKFIQQSPVTITDAGEILISGTSPKVSASGDLLIQPTGDLTLRSGGTGRWLHADGSTALEITPALGGSLVIHDLVRSPSGMDIQISPARHLLLTPAYNAQIQAGSGYETILYHGTGGSALRVTSGEVGMGDGIILQTQKLLPGGAGRTIGHISLSNRQFDAIYSREFSGGENYNSTLKAHAGREARLESADAIARVQVNGSTGNVDLNANTWVNGILSVYAGLPATSVPGLGDRHQLFVDALTGELSIRKIGGSLVSLEGGGGTGPGVAPGRGQVSVNALITAGTTVTSALVTTLPNSNGLQPYTDVEDFVNNIFVYMNGQLLTAGGSLGDNPDIYPSGNAASGEFALTRDLRVSDILQILKFTAIT